MNQFRIYLYQKVRPILFFAFILLLSCYTGFDYYEGVELDELQILSNEVNILLFGDWGAGTIKQRNVANSMITAHNTKAFDFALVLGDNFYPSGVKTTTDSKWDTVFRDVYPAESLAFPFYVVLGNHDYYGNPYAQYEYVEPEHDRWICVSYGYVLPVRLLDDTLIEIFLLDSEVLAQEDVSADALASWAQRRIRASEADYKILATHRPIFSSGSHGGDSSMSKYFLKEFEDGYLDMSVAGHDHHMELQSRSLDDDGLDDELFIVSGGGGGKVRPAVPGSHSDYSEGIFGFTTLEITGSNVSVSFYDQDENKTYPGA